MDFAPRRLSSFPLFLLIPSLARSGLWTSAGSIVPSDVDSSNVESLPPLLRLVSSDTPPSLPRALFGCALLCLTVPVPPSYLPFLSSPGFYTSPELTRAPSRASGDITGKKGKTKSSSRPQYKYPCIRGGTLYRASDRANGSCRKQYPCRVTECQRGGPGLGQIRYLRVISCFCPTRCTNVLLLSP
jgi:hypothetical protein